MRSKNFNITQGLSLIEVIIALAVLALIMAGLIGIFSQGFLQSKKIREVTAAYALAREELEERDWAQLVNATDTEDLNNIAYTITFTVSDGPCPLAKSGCPPNDELKRLDVSVSWAEGSVTLSTFKADY